MYDVVRLDHFRGFESYWAVPAEDDTARRGHWLPGPGWDFIGTLRERLPGMEFIPRTWGTSPGRSGSSRRTLAIPA